MSCHSSKHQSNTSESELLTKAEELLNSNDVQVLPNSSKEYFLCYSNKKNTSQMKTQLKYVILDNELQIKYPVKTLTEGSVEWIDETNIKTIQKMGIAQAGKSNILSFSINIINGNSTKL